jgi:peptide/nickel transport system permease protein
VCALAETAATSSVTEPAVRLHRRRLIPSIPLRSGFLIGGVIILVFVLIAVFAPWIAPYDPNATHLTESLGGISSSHILGQDAAGRDVFSRLVYGARLSLLGPLLVVLLSVVVGGSAGLVAGFRGGAIDQTLSRLWDIVFGFPALLLAIIIVATFGASFTTAVIAIAITYIPLLARVVRGVVMVESRKPYVDALRIQGFGGFRAATLHVLPNVAGPIVAQSTLNFGYALLDLAALAFLGLGTQPPTADWGVMLSDGRQNILLSATEVLVASITIAVAVIAFNLIGDSLTKRLEKSR